MHTRLASRVDFQRVGDDDVTAVRHPGRSPRSYQPNQLYREYKLRPELVETGNACALPYTVTRICLLPRLREDEAGSGDGKPREGGKPLDPLKGGEGQHGEASTRIAATLMVSLMSKLFRNPRGGHGRVALPNLL